MNILHLLWSYLKPLNYRMYFDFCDFKLLSFCWDESFFINGIVEKVIEKMGISKITVCSYLD
ncbi:hypothetical protein UT300018_31550 [Clostridium faecium]